MPHFEDHNIWQMLYDHMPPVIRYILGGAVTIIIVLIGFIWRGYRKDLKEARSEHKYFIREPTLQQHHEYMNDKVDDIRKEFSESFDRVHAEIETFRKETNTKYKTLEVYMQQLMNHFIQHIEKDNDKS